MTIDTDILSKIIAPVLTAAILAIIKFYLEGKSKLTTYYSHSSSFNLKDINNTIINTHSIVLINTGKKTAKNVRVSHANLPININVFPHIEFEIKKNEQNGTADLIFSTLVPKEQVTISYLYFPPLTWNNVNSTIKSDDGFAQQIQFIPSPQPNKITTWATSILTFIGASFLLYVIITTLLGRI
ncbi:hypothetical protein G3257_11610 [Janthinobacterium lividum]|uniref:hypothetical protein n=1 Tax=Janthinobacterium lividum TaxID=29581 RepID=UPI001594F829|nr:hypothetical protein [Janthinobacterium lividum]QKY02826.1 hypothetical protein G3257_11610 [Janthinobacterium lividum]